MQPIPSEYKQFLLEASNLVFGRLEIVTAGDLALHTHLPEVTAQAWEQGLPRDLIPIGILSNGYFCIDQGGEIHLWKNHELTDNFWPDIWHWAEAVLLES